MCVASFPLKLQIFVKKLRVEKVKLRMVKGLLKARATRLCSPLGMEEPMAS